MLQRKRDAATCATLSASSSSNRVRRLQPHRGLGIQHEVRHRLKVFCDRSLALDPRPSRASATRTRPRMTVCGATAAAAFAPRFFVGRWRHSPILVRLRRGQAPAPCAAGEWGAPYDPCRAISVLATAVPAQHRLHHFSHACFPIQYFI
jgi:hypothetical protein